MLATFDPSVAMDISEVIPALLYFFCLQRRVQENATAVTYSGR